MDILSKAIEVREDFKITKNSRNNRGKTYSQNTYAPVKVKNRFSILKDENDFIVIPDVALKQVQKKKSGRIPVQGGNIQIEKDDINVRKNSLNSHEKRNRNFSLLSTIPQIDGNDSDIDEEVHRVSLFRIKNC